MGTHYSRRHAAVLMEQFPPTAGRLAPRAPMPSGARRTTCFGASAHTLRVIAWQSTEDGAKGRRQPKPLPTPADRARVERKLQATDLDFINRKLGFTEVADGN